MNWSLRHRATDSDGMKVRPLSMSPHRLARPVGATLVMGCLTFVAVFAALRFFRIPGIGSPIFWPVAGIAVAILLRSPRRWWWALLAAFVGGYLGANLSMNSWPVAITYLLTGLVEVTVTAIVLTRPGRLGRTDGLRTAVDSVRFIAAATLAIATGAALIGLSALIFPADRPAFAFIGGYLLGHMLGMLALAPVLMRHDITVGRGGWRTVEFVAVMAMTVAFGWWIFLTPHGDLYPYPLIVPVVWAAIRFGAWRSTAVLGMAVGLVALGTARGLGPFVGIAALEPRDLTTQLYLATLAGTAVALVVVTRHRSELAARARASEEALAGAIRDSTAGIYSIWLDPPRLGLIREVNPAFCAMLGYRAEDLVGRHCSILGARSEPGPRAILEGFLRRMADGTMSGYREESRFVHGSGASLWVQINIGTVRPPGDAAFALVQVHDLTVRERNRAELEHLALHDALTGLANRTLLFQRMAEALDKTDRGVVGLLYLDLDEFKEINDRYGHDAGDTVLVAVAQRLSAAARPGDTVARLGGDEFAVLCPSLPDAAALTPIAERMRTAVRGPIGLSPKVTVTIDVSIGRSAAHGVTDVDTLLREADQAMYVVKQAQRATT